VKTAHVAATPTISRAICSKRRTIDSAVLLIGTRRLT